MYNIFMDPTALNVMKRFEALEMPDGYNLKASLRPHDPEVLGLPVIVLTLTHRDRKLTRLELLERLEEFPEYAQHVVEGMLMEMFRASWGWRKEVAR